jgi:hypothetical protein
MRAICDLESSSTLSFSRHHGTPKLNRELDKDYETRTWRERAHYDEQGRVYIPANMISSAIKASALYLSLKVPGKGNSTYTKNFKAGLIVLDGLYVGITKDELKSETLFVPSDGKSGGSKRVEKVFPIVPKWSGQIVAYIADPIITEDVFLQHLKVTGNFIGLGRWRPRNGGLYGRFAVKAVKWAKDGDDLENAA